MSKITYHATSTSVSIEKIKRLSVRVTRRSVERLGDEILEEAKKNAPEFTGRLRESGIRTPVVRADNLVHTGVEFTEPYAKYIENGFAGHFVPFSVAPSLYLQAVSVWGWRVARPDEVRNPKNGMWYLIPPGGKRPKYGVYVNGDAKPFLRPAVRKMREKKRVQVIFKEEFEKTLGAHHG